METPARSPIDSKVQYDLLRRARRAAEFAYAPYSDFPVGAAVLASDGSITAGCNVENASIGLTICAEQSAMSAAVSAGHHEILAVAVSAPKSPGTTPCGACRQFLNEFRPRSSDIAVVLDDGCSGNMVWLDDLLPQAFGPRNLDSEIEDTNSATVTRRGNGR
ncbi:MAG: cytidine deaminase [Chloroflexi bacterium]|nr:cytidine deaminase [Chloroflexota bacterium]